MEEIWKSIPQYQGIYEVSNLGQVRSIEGKVTQSVLHGTRHWHQRILKQKTDAGGYKRVALWKDKKTQTHLVHRLVAMAFIKSIPGKELINHIDGNPSNNLVSNLEWTDFKGNLSHAYWMGLNETPNQVVLVSTKTHESKFFMSYASASRFLGHNSGFISNKLKQGKTIVDDYEIYLKAREVTDGATKNV